MEASSGFKDWKRAWMPHHFLQTVQGNCKDPPLHSRLATSEVMCVLPLFFCWCRPLARSFGSVDTQNVG